MRRRFSILSSTLLVASALAIAAQAPVPAFLRKPSAGGLRILTWNVGDDGIVPADGAAVDFNGDGRPSRFARVLHAVQPDIGCLQQSTVDAAKASALADQILPLADGRKWQAYAAVETIILSRFPLTARTEGLVTGEAGRLRGHTVALIDPPPPFSAMWLACVHFQSAAGQADIEMRRRQAELIVSTFLDARAGRGPLAVAPRTPFVVLGDMNAITGLTDFIDVILDGRASAQPAVAAAAGMDWDGTSMTDARPTHNGSGKDTYTWRDDVQPFPPGVLDRVLYSDSVLDAVNAFVLNTMAMTPADLAGAGLRPADVMRDPARGIYDHLPLVVDFVLKK